MGPDDLTIQAGQTGAIPTVSICIPTYNRKNILINILEMVRKQTFLDFEVIVCDDSSSDGTHAYLSSLDWPNLSILRNDPNMKYPGTMARLFGHARGKYIAVQHDHDPIEPHWLERMVNMMERHPTAGLGCCACRVLDGQGQLIEEPKSGLWEVFPLSGFLPGHQLIEVLATKIHTPLAVTASLFRREMVERVGGYRADWYLAADEDLYRRLSTISDAAFCPERLFTLAARPRESGKNMGSWRGIYTLYEFRRDTALNFCGCGTVRKQWLVFRLKWLKQVLLWREALSHWLWDDMEGLMDALRAELVPPLPSRRPPLSSAEKAILRGLILILRWTRPLGRRIGNWRHG